MSFVFFKSYHFLFPFSFVIFLLVLFSSSSITINHANNLFKTINFIYSSPSYQLFAQYAVAPSSPTGPTVMDPTLKALSGFSCNKQGIN